MAASRFDRATVLSLLILYVVWGSTYLVMRFAVEGLPPLLMGAGRFITAGLTVLAFFRWRGEPWPTARQWLYSLPIGICFFVCGNGFVAIAETKIASGVAAVVCAMSPILAAAMGPLFGERTTAREWVGLVMGIAGVVVLSRGAEVQDNLGAAMVLFLAPTAWSIGTLLARRLDLPRGVMASAPQMILGGLVLLAAGLLRGERIVEVPPTKALLSWLYLYTFGSLVAFSAYTYLVKHTRTAVALSYAYVNPAVAVLLGVVFGAEALGPHTVFATALITLATVLMLVAKAPPPAAQGGEGAQGLGARSTS